MDMEKRLPLSQYATITKDCELLMQSTSGGAFTELARVVLQEGGVVFGVVWDERFHAVHKWTDSDAGLAEMRGSKYVTSDMSGVYGPLRNFLKSGRKVLFTGTPCQTAAVRKMFGHNANLVLCSLICMANAMPKKWEAYINRLERKARSRITLIKQRCKVAGKNGAFFKVEFADSSKNFIQSLHQNSYWQSLRARPRQSCLSCQFRCGRHCADLQIGDFWGAEKVFPDLEAAKGISVVMTYSTEGEEILSRANLEMKPVAYEQVLAGNPFLESQYVPIRGRNFFVRGVGWVKTRVCALVRCCGGGRSA